MNRILNNVLNILYPRCCPICHRILKDQNRMICPECEKRIHPVGQPRCYKCGKPVQKGEYCPDCQHHPHLFEQGRGIFVYNDLMRRSLIRYKYYGCREYGDFYARSMYIFAKKEIEIWKPDLIVPVPLHRSKLRMRGFNQAADLAVKLSQYTGIPADTSLVEKIRKTKSQKKLSAYERRKNLEEAFRVKRSLPGFTILVIDDVYTTGSTIDAMAACLRKKGADKIFFLTVCIGRI
ncbi:MAG: ComF family protein [Clostridia bacterium]|nr:ComF family protein [Clostridia bacterium]MDY5554758.1 ComF family protein [Blautia sp.]